MPVFQALMVTRWRDERSGVGMKSLSGALVGFSISLLLVIIFNKALS